jgi:hypothetical protein
MLETFVRRQRSFMGKVPGLTNKDEKIEELVADLDRQSIWMNGRREFLAKALLKVRGLLLGICSVANQFWI